MWVFSIIGRNKKWKAQEKTALRAVSSKSLESGGVFRMQRYLGKDPLLDPSRRKSLYRRQELGHPLDP